MIIDAHIHLGDTPPRDGAPMTAERVVRLMDSEGVARAVIVPVRGAGAAAAALRAAERYPGRFAVINRFSPESAEDFARLEHWRAHPAMIGARLELLADRVECWKQTGALHAFFSSAEWLGLPVMLFSRTGLAGLAGLIVRYPRLRLIINHANLAGAQPFQARSRVAELCRLAAFPNIAVQMAGLPAFSHQGAPFADMQALARQILAAYGARRVLWGSDHTLAARRGVTYQQSVAFGRQVAALSDDPAWVLGRSAAVWLDWPESSPR